MAVDFSILDKLVNRLEKDPSGQWFARTYQGSTVLYEDEVLGYAGGPVPSEIQDVYASQRLAAIGRVSTASTNPAGGVDLVAGGAQIRAVRNNRACVLGDSLVENGKTESATTAIYTARNIAQLAAAKLNQRLRVLNNAGVSGNTTAQMLARFDTEVAPYVPDWVIVIGCSNDIDNGLTGNDILSSLDAIYAKCQIIGANMVFTNTSAGGYGTELKHTYWYQAHQGCIDRHNTLHGFYYAPMYFGAVDLTTTNNAAYSTAKAGMLYDARHPSASGVHTVYSEAVAAFFDSFLPSNQSGHGSRSSATVGDLSCLTLNGLMSATGGTAGTGNTATVMPNLWTGARTGMITAAFDVANRSDGRAGRWLTAALSGAIAVTDSVTVSSPVSSFAAIASPAIGQLVRFEADCEATASSGTIGQLEFEVQILNSAGTLIFTAAANRIAAGEYLGITGFSGRLATPDFIMPAAASRVVTILRMATSVGGVAVVKWGSVSGEVATEI